MVRTEFEGKVITKNPFYIVLKFTVPWKKRIQKTRVPKSLIKNAIRYGTSDAIEAYLNSRYFNRHGWALINFEIPIEVLKEIVN